MLQCVHLKWENNDVLDVDLYSHDNRSLADFGRTHQDSQVTGSEIQGFFIDWIGQGHSHNSYTTILPFICSVLQCYSGS